MSSQTSLVAEQVRLWQWAAQIQECQNRSADMKVETWCSEHGIVKIDEKSGREVDIDKKFQDVGCQLDVDEDDKKCYMK